MTPTPGKQDVSLTRNGGRHTGAPSIPAINSSPSQADCQIGLRVQGMQSQEAGPGRLPLAPPKHTTA